MKFSFLATYVPKLFDGNGGWQISAPGVDVELVSPAQVRKRLNELFLSEIYSKGKRAKFLVTGDGNKLVIERV